jgi:shikimate dehydrogenase
MLVGETKLQCFAVMGNPIAHSLSPLIHTRFAQQAGLELRYDKIEVAKECFESEVSSFFAQGGKGLNITLPFKQRAFAMAARCTPRCQQAKAANTLWMSGKKLHADNTDGIGLIRDLSNYQQIAGKRVLLLGAGGAARGIIAPLLAAQVAQLIVVNRSEERAEALQADFAQIECCRLSELQGSYDLIINATSASLTEERLSLPQSVLEAIPFCYDLAYSKEGTTSFVQWAHERGLDAVDGLGMLVEQAAEAFFIWHGLRPDTASVLSELRKEVL